MAAAFLAWRIASIGMSAYYVDLFERGDTEAVPSALAWNDRDPAATFRKALSILEEDAEAAKPLLDKAYSDNVSDARPLLALASIASTRGDDELADALVIKAVQLRPADPALQQQVAGYWASRGEMEMAMRHWSQALSADPAARQRLFPLLLEIAEDPKARGAFRSVARVPPSWWESFFTMVALRAMDIETVRVFYALRRGEGETPVTEQERKVYVERLWKEGQITEAYLVWVNGLTELEQEYLALLFNGGFELEPGNIGFSWRLSKTDDVIATTGTTYGVDGKKALHLIFKGREAYYGHVFQRLFLAPGTYRVTGQVRTDSLKTKGGIKWVVSCGHPRLEPLGESERFLGSGEWREFLFQFQVPEDCMAQEIRLRSGGSSPDEHKTRGGAWFDGMAIQKILGNTASSDG